MPSRKSLLQPYSSDPLQCNPSPILTENPTSFGKCYFRNGWNLFVHCNIVCSDIVVLQKVCCTFANLHLTSQQLHAHLLDQAYDNWNEEWGQIQRRRSREEIFNKRNEGNGLLGEPSWPMAEDVEIEAWDQCWVDREEGNGRGRNQFSILLHAISRTKDKLYTMQ